MTHPNAELLRRAYDAFDRGNVEPLIAVLADDISWRDSNLGPVAGRYTGKQEVLGLFGKTMEVYEGTLRVTVVDILADDTYGVVLTREQGSVGGEVVTWTGVHLWTFPDGLCEQFEAYVDGDYQRFWSSRNTSVAGAR